MLSNTPGFQDIKELPSGKQGRRIILQKPVGKNPFLQTEMQPFQQNKNQSQQSNQLQSQIVEVIYNKLTAQQTSILSKDTIVVQDGSIIDQLIRRHKKENPHGRSGYKSFQQQQEIAQSNLDSSRAILDAYQPRGIRQKQHHQSMQPPVIARPRKNNQLTNSPKQQKCVSQCWNQKLHKQVNDISDVEDSMENIPSIPIQTAISEYNQDTTNTIQQYAHSFSQIAKAPSSYVQLNQIDEVVKNLRSIMKSRTSQNANKGKQNVPILQVTQQAKPQGHDHIYRPIEEQQVVQPGNLIYDDVNQLNDQELDMADGDGSGLWRGDFHGIIEKPQEEAALEDPVIQLGSDALPEYSFNDQSYNTMNVRKSQSKPEANEFTVKKTQHKPIEITAERDSFSSGLQSVQAINQIDQQAQKLLEAQENEPEVQLPICDGMKAENNLDIFDKSTTPDGQSMTTPKVSKEDIVNVVKEVLPSLLDQYKAQNNDVANNDAKLAEMQQKLQETVEQKLRAIQQNAEISPLVKNEYNLSKSNYGPQKSTLDASELQRQEQLKREQEEKLRQLQEKESELQKQEQERLNALQRQNEKEKQLTEKERQLLEKEAEIVRMKELLEKRLQEAAMQPEQPVQQQTYPEDERLVKKDDEPYKNNSVEFVQMEQDSIDEEPEKVQRNTQNNYDETPQPHNPGLRDIPINELSNDELLNNDFSTEEHFDRPLNRSGHRSQSHSFQDRTSMPPEATPDGQRIIDIGAKKNAEEEEKPENIKVVPVDDTEDFDNLGNYNNADYNENEEKKDEDQNVDNFDHFGKVDDLEEPNDVENVPENAKYEEINDLPDEDLAQDESQKQEPILGDAETIEVIEVGPTKGLDYSSATDFQSSPERGQELVIDDHSGPKAVPVEAVQQVNEVEYPKEAPIEESCSPNAPVSQLSQQYEMMNSGPEVQLEAVEVTDEKPAQAEQNVEKPSEKPINEDFDDVAKVDEPAKVGNEEKQMEKASEAEVQQQQPISKSLEPQAARVMKGQGKTIPDYKQGIDPEGDMFYVPDTLCTRPHYEEFIQRFIDFLEAPIKYEEPIDHLFTKQNIQVADYILDQLDIVYGIRLKSKPGKQLLRSSDDIINQYELTDLINVEIENANIEKLKLVVPELFQKLAKKPCLEEASRQPIKRLEGLTQPTEDELLVQCLDGVDGVLDDIIDEVADELLSGKLPYLG